MSKIVYVSVKVVATSEGYYQNRIIRVGEEFTYNGGLNGQGGLPLWVEPLDKDWKKKLEPKAPVAPVAPIVPPADLGAPVVAGSTKPLTKAELVAKLSAEGKGQEEVLKKMKLEELRALDAQPVSLASVM